MKTYFIQYNVGYSKYVISHNNGVDIHQDGSDFFHVRVFKNKKEANEWIGFLNSEGYKKQ